MRRISLYIADMDPAFIKCVLRSISASHKPIDVVGTTGSGEHALRDIIRLRPDVFLSDISLPELDGFSLLRELRRLRKPPITIVATYFYSWASVEYARQYGASFFLCKPIELDSLPNLILECCKYRSQQIPQAQIDEPQKTDQHIKAAHKLLKEMGMPSRLRGTAYILEAVSSFSGDNNLLKNLSSGLYAQIAERMDTTVPCVERSLRSAIAIGYERGSLAERFSRRPSNKEFLEYVMRAAYEAEDSEPL